MASLIKSIMGGISISIGAYAYLITLNKSNNPILASCVFYIGLALIFVLGANLFTGKVLTDGSIKKGHFKNLSVYWIGNLVGSIIAVVLLNQIYTLDITNIISNKMNLSLTQMFISAIFCNMLVCSAVLSYKNTKNHIYSWFFITIFVLCGFEHVVANFTYYTVGILKGLFSIKMIAALIVVTIGNFIGGRIIYYVDKNNR